MEKKLTCIICPRGCRLTVRADGDNIEVEGNFCPRGKAYATDEMTNPRRTVTSTVRVRGGGVVSVKTDRPIPKESVGDCMRVINSITAELPVKIGDVLSENVFGARIVATQNKG